VEHITLLSTSTLCISIGHRYLLDFCTVCPSNPFHFAKCQQCSQVNAWPWEPGVDFKESLKHQGFSPQFSFTWLVNSLSQSKEILQPSVECEGVMGLQ